MTLVVECRAGGLARAGLHAAGGAEGHAQLPMERWKALIDEAAVRPEQPVVALFFGEANLIAGYRLYYMLRYASRAGLHDVTLVTDGRFWIDEASTWLLECGLTRIAIVNGSAAAGLDLRIAEMHAIAERTSTTAPEVVHLPPGVLRGARTIDWRGDEIAST